MNIQYDLEVIEKGIAEMKKDLDDLNLLTLDEYPEKGKGDFYRSLSALRELSLSIQENLISLYESSIHRLQSSKKSVTEADDYLAGGYE